MLLYKSIVHPVNVYSVLITFLQKGWNRKRKGINPNFVMRRELAQQDFLLEKQNRMVFRLMGVFLMKLELRGSWFKISTREYFFT